jgi:hypothetical protein
MISCGHMLTRLGIRRPNGPKTWMNSIGTDHTNARSRDINTN